MPFSTAFASSAMETAACCGEHLRLFRLQWKFQCKGRALTNHAVHLDLTLVGFHDGLDIAKSQPKSFDIVNIPRMSPVELLEDTSLRLLAHTDAIVLYTYDQALGSAMSSDPYEKIFF